MTDVPKEITSSLHRAFLENVKARRKQLKLTQVDVASRLGTSRVFFTQIETGQFVPGLDLIGRIAQALEMQANELLIEADVHEPVA